MVFVTGYKGARGVGSTPFEAQCNARANWCYQQERNKLTVIKPEEEKENVQLQLQV